MDHVLILLYVALDKTFFLEPLETICCFPITGTSLERLEEQGQHLLQLILMLGGCLFNTLLDRLLK